MCGSKGAKEAADELQKEDPEAMQLEIIHQERKVVDILEQCHALSWEVCSQRLGVYKRFFVNLPQSMAKITREMVHININE